MPLPALRRVPLPPLLLRLVLRVPLTLVLLILIIQLIEVVLEPPRPPLLIVAQIRVLILTLLISLFFVSRRATSIVNVASESSGNPTTFDSTFDFAEVKHVGIVDPILALESDVHRGDHVELHALDVTGLALVETTTLAAAAEGVFFREAVKLGVKVRVSEE